MNITVETVTPKIAEAWLNANKSNRKLRDGVVEKYSTDMADGKWTACPEPITFYVDGDLADGQHRLWAIIESGKSIIFPICRGLPREAGLNINVGLGRSLVDNARISGVDTGLSNELISVARACEQGIAQPSGMSNAARLTLVEAHREAAQWAVSNGPRGRGLRNAVILAAFARAWYHEDDLERLKRCAEVISTGFSDGELESAAIALRNYLLDKGSVLTSHGLWRETFLKAQNAISYFMRRRKLTVIKSISDEAYPIKKTRRKVAA